MRPADEVAFFGAIADAAKRKQDEAKAKVIALGEEVGSTSFKSVGGSKATIAEPDAKVEVDRAGLLAWMQKHQPHNIESTVRPAAAKAFESKCEITNGGVIYTETGEVVDFATTKPRDPYVSWIGGKPVKDQAYDWMTARADELLSAMEETRQGSIEQAIDDYDREH